MSSGGVLEGTVVHKSSRSVRVVSSGALLRCSLRGRFRGSGSRGLPVVVGDRVRLRELGGGEGVIEEVLERQNELRRSRSGPPGDAQAKAARPGRELVVAANIDQVLAVLAARHPPPRWGLVDRILVSARYEGFEAAICVNKSDQLADDAVSRAANERDASVYRRLGYPVFSTSALERTALGPLKEWLSGRTTVLSGHSGVGKSTLLNALCPGVGATTGDLNVVTGRGRHTTAAASLFSLPEGGFLVDTPGFREYGLGGLDPADVSRLYPELQPLVGSCRFKNCLHLDEPRCAVLRALGEGRVSRLRYENYRGIVESLRSGE